MSNNQGPHDLSSLAGTFRPCRTGSVTDIAWLETHRLQSVLRREHDWVFTFDDKVHLYVECLWRLLVEGRIRITSEDDGRQFGLPAPLVAAEEVSRYLVGGLVESVGLHEGTLDLELRFDTSHVLQFLPTSVGYEAWNLWHHDLILATAVGGGRLDVDDGPAST